MHTLTKILLDMFYCTNKLINTASRNSYLLMKLSACYIQVARDAASLACYAACA